MKAAGGRAAAAAMGKEAWVRLPSVAGQGTPVPSRLATELRQDLKARTLSFQFRGDVADVDRELIDELIAVSDRAGQKNARICLHSGPEATFHDMVTLEYATGYARPHRHVDKGETVHIIEGQTLFVVFDDQGKVTNHALLGDRATLVFRVGVGQWHAVIPVTPYAIYHESKLGPFLANDSIYPAWAPDGSDPQAAAVYVRRLVRHYAS